MEILSVSFSNIREVSRFPFINWCHTRT